MDDVIAKSRHLLELFGYKVSSRVESEVESKIRGTVDGSDRSTRNGTGTGTGIGTGTLDTTEHPRVQLRVDRTDTESSAKGTISKVAVLAGDNRIENAITDSAGCGSMEFKAQSSASRTLEVLPLPARTPQQWALEFKAVLTARLKTVLESESDRKDNDKNKDKNNIGHRIAGQSALEAGIHEQLVASAPGLDIRSDAMAAIMINEPFSVRLPEDLYGRRLTEIRRLYTDDDCDPLDVE